MKAFSSELSFEVTWKPFFLNPTTPEGGVPLEQYLAKKYGPRAAALAKEGTSPLSKAGSDVVTEINFYNNYLLLAGFTCSRVWYSKMAANENILDT